MTSTADVVVVGGGVVGASTAYHLAAAGVEHVVLLERADSVATGSTGACAGGFRHQFSSRINIELSLASVPMILGFTEEHGLPLDVVQDGYLFLVRDEGDWADFRAGAELQRSLGVDTRAPDARGGRGRRAGHRARRRHGRVVLRRRRHRGSSRAHAGVRDARATFRRRRAAGCRGRRDRDDGAVVTGVRTRRRLHLRAGRGERRGAVGRDVGGDRRDTPSTGTHPTHGRDDGRVPGRARATDPRDRRRDLLLLPQGGRRGPDGDGRPRRAAVVQHGGRPSVHRGGAAADGGTACSRRSNTRASRACGRASTR